MPVPIVAHPFYEASLPDGHRFPMGKYGRVVARIEALGLVPDGFVRPEPASAELLGRAHDPDYVAAVLSGSVAPEIERRIGLPVTEAVVRRSLHAVGGTLAAARLALRHGLAGSAAGGSHHAQRTTGAGFCVLNDVAVAAKALQRDGSVRRVLVVDLDVHQGDGTADCLSRDPDLFTFSMHAEKNYPVRKIPGDLDVGLPDRMEDEAYLAALARHLPGLLDGLRPDLVIYNAGVDPHAEDRLGRLSLSDEGLRRRDAYVIAEARRRRVPLAAVVGGGYGSDIEALARRHGFTFEALAEAAAREGA